jgi:uncharacterized protein (TIGR02452 family)
MNHHNDKEALVAQAERTKAILATGIYSVAGTTIDLRGQLAATRSGTRLLRPVEWDGILQEAQAQCRGKPPALLTVTAESTLAALQRLAGAGQPDVAALNFASARRPGGGWDTGAQAQEETLARASGLIASLTEAPRLYQANRQHEHLFYTDHAIWSPAVPHFVGDDGALLVRPYTAGIITMPAPNVGGMMRLEEADLLALPTLWRRRIRCVLALAIVERVRHLILGAWGCGAFGNDPQLVARWFSEVLAPSEPWLRGFETVTFAIYDTSRHQSCLTAFTHALEHAP